MTRADSSGDIKVEYSRCHRHPGTVCLLKGLVISKWFINGISLVAQCKSRNSLRVLQPEHGRTEEHMRVVCISKPLSLLFRMRS